MPLQIVRNDITKIKADAIVNAANQFACVGTGVDLSIYNAAGYEALLCERKKIGTIETGECMPTSALNLDALYIIHTVGMYWEGGSHGEEAVLRNCYRNSLKMAKHLKCNSVAIPLMATGNYCYPKELAFGIAQEEIEAFLKRNDILVILVIFDKECLTISQKRFDDIKEYIDNKYVEEHNANQVEEIVFQRTDKSINKRNMQPKLTIEQLLDRQDETFTEMVLRIMEEKKLKPAEVYNAANLDRKAFSKIKTNINFHPNKLTAISIAVGLKLTVSEAQRLLGTAGYSLSRSDKFDLIIMYCLDNKIYKYMEINFMLDDYGFEGIGQRGK